MAESSSCETVSQMCNLKWPGLHVSPNRRSVCFANEWVPAQPYSRLCARTLHSFDASRRFAVIFNGFSKVVSRNVNYTMIVICGIFLCRNGTTLCPQRRKCRNCSSGKKAQIKMTHSLKKKTYATVLFLHFYSSCAGACLTTARQNKIASSVSRWLN